jgi:hypothetical protein
VQLAALEMRMRVSISQLGLAAYVKMEGAELLSVEGKTFHFESPISLAEWRVKYNNSCCMRHDALVCELRRPL